MALIKKEVEVSKESSELGESLITLIKSIKEHGADGFQVATDVPAIILENLNSLMAGIDGIDKIGGELKESLPAFIKAWAIAGADVAGLFVKKDVEA